MLRFALISVTLFVVAATSGRAEINREFVKISEWLEDNVKDEHSDSNLMVAADQFAAQGSTMGEQERAAWALFTKLQSLQRDCSLEAAKVFHENFDQVAMNWMPLEEPTMRIQQVLLDAQRHHTRVCASDYIKQTRKLLAEAHYGEGEAQEFEDFSDDDLVGKFLMNYDSYVPNGHYNEYPGMSDDLFLIRLKQAPVAKIAKIIYEASSNKQSKDLVGDFMFVCDQLKAHLADKIDRFIIPDTHFGEGNYGSIKLAYQRAEMCRLIRENFPADQLTEAMSRLAEDKFAY